MNKKYFRYLFNSYKNLSVFLLIVNVVAVTFTYFVSYMNNIENSFTLVVETGIVVNIIVSLVLPLIYFSFMDTKKGVDHYLTLPIQRSQIVCTTIVFMVLQSFITYFIAFFPVLIFDLVTKGYESFKVLQIFSILLMISCAIVTSSAVKMKFYSTIDSGIGLLAYIFLPMIIYLSIISLIQGVSYGLTAYSYINTEYFFYPGVMFMVGTLAPLIDANLNIVNDYIPYLFELIAVAAIGLISIRYDIKNRKAEYANNLSNNIMAYPMIIRFATLALIMMAVIGLREDMAILIIALAIIFICYLVMNFVATRVIKINKKNIIFYIISIFLVCGVIQLGDITNGFGLTYSYKNLSLEQYAFSVTIEDPRYSNISYEFNVLNEGDEIDQKTEKIIKQLQNEYIKNYEGNQYSVKEDGTKRYLYSHLNVVYDQGKEFYYNNIGDGRNNHYLNCLNEQTIDLMEELVNLNDVTLSMGKFDLTTGSHISFDNFEDFKQELEMFF